jgi:hypothetical protein
MYGHIWHNAYFYNDSHRPPCALGPHTKPKITFSLNALKTKTENLEYLCSQRSYPTRLNAYLHKLAP